MISRIVVRALTRLVCVTLAVVCLAYSLSFVFHLVHTERTRLADLIKPRMPDAASRTTYERCTDCRPSSARYDTMFSCHDCVSTSDAPVPVPLSHQTLAGVRYNVVREAIADNAALAFLHCPYAYAWWCHDAAAWFVTAVLDSAPLEVHPLSLFSLLSLLALLAAYLYFAYGIYVRVVRDRAKLHAVQTEDYDASRLGLARIAADNSLHTQ
ncbi:MAG: hypothetical protein Q7V62_08195 [Actinomycetota bacterium]|nr:hypothetical protein [Actinomycetota bacterium]